MIEDIESFSPELQLQSFTNRKIPPDRQVHLPGSKTPRKVSRCVTEASAHISKSLGVYRPAPRTAHPRSKLPQRLKNTVAVGAIQVDRLARDEVEPCIIRPPVHVPEPPSVQSYWESRATGKPPVQTPPMNQGLQQRALSNEGHSFGRTGYI